MIRGCRCALRKGAHVLITAVLLAAAAAAAEGQSRAPKPKVLPRGTPTPQLRPTPAPTPRPLPDLVPDVVFNRVQQTTRADGTPCAIWDVFPEVVNYPTNDQYAATEVGFTVVLERRTGPGDTFVLACPTCRFEIPPLGGGLKSKHTSSRQFNDCGYGPAYSPYFRIRVDIKNVVEESNERNNAKVRPFPNTH